MAIMIEHYLTPVDVIFAFTVIFTVVAIATGVVSFRSPEPRTREHVGYFCFVMSIIALFLAFMLCQKLDEKQTPSQASVEVLSPGSVDERR